MRLTPYVTDILNQIFFATNLLPDLTFFMQVLKATRVIDLLLGTKLGPGKYCTVIRRVSLGKQKYKNAYNVQDRIYKKYKQNQVKNIVKMNGGFGKLEIIQNPLKITL